MRGPVERAGVDDDAAQSGPVAAHVLGGGVNDDVRAVLEGAAQDRRGHRVVDDERQAELVRLRRPRVEVDDVECRVADRLAEHKPCALVDHSVEHRGVVRAHEACLDAELGEGVGEQCVRPAVQRRDGDDVVSGARQVEDRVRDRRSSGRGGERADATLEGRDTLFEDRRRRIHEPRVDVAWRLQCEEIRGVLGVVESVRDCLVYRNGKGVRRGIDRLTGVDRDCLRLLRHRNSSRSGVRTGYRRSRRSGLSFLVADTQCVTSNSGVHGRREATT